MDGTEPLGTGPTPEKPLYVGWFENSGRLYQQKVREMSLLRRLSDSVSLDLDLEQAVQFILDIMVDELDITTGSILLFDEITQRLALQCIKRQDGESTTALHDRNPLEDRICEAIARTVLKSHEPIFIHDTETDSRVLAHTDKALSIHSLLCLPLIVRGKSVGVISLSHEEKNGFSRGDLHGFTVVANQIAMMLDNAENYASIRRANLELESKVQERTRYLKAANRELQQTRSSLIQSERLKALGQMASGVAHDFNNMLTGIIGNTQLMLENVEDGRLKQRLEAIELAALDGAATVNRIQEFSRIKRNGELGPLHPNDLVGDVVKITSPLWKDQAQRQGRTVELITRLANVRPVEGNATELREVLTNVIINALDAMPAGGQIVFSTCMASDTVCMSVSDTGSGMTKQIRDRLFDPFFSTKGPDNSGLGLSVAYGIIQRHNGSISVDSTLGQGTTFLIHLPSCIEPERQAKREQEIRQVDSASILVIDDDSSVRDILSAMLHQAGHDVAAAACGEDGIETFRHGSFNLVFTDLGMSGLGGWDVAAAIKELSPTTPVVLITGWGQELEAAEIKARGVDFLLNKPVELATLANIVADALDPVP